MIQHSEPSVRRRRYVLNRSGPTLMKCFDTMKCFKGAPPSSVPVATIYHVLRLDTALLKEPALKSRFIVFEDDMVRSYFHGFFQAARQPAADVGFGVARFGNDPDIELIAAKFTVVFRIEQ